ncbi:MAG: Crp/Fnr family transcriptional regulator [Verrucomicrobiales bacterium]
MPEPLQTSDHDQTLPGLALMGELSEEIRAQLAQAGRFETLPVGAYLATQGQPHHNLGIVLSGKLSVSVHAHGDTVHLATLGPGETVGEMNFIDPHPASADVVVVEEPARIWSIAEADFAAFVERNPAAGYTILKVLARELCRRLRLGSEKMLRQVEAARLYYRDLDY